MTRPLTVSLSQQGISTEAAILANLGTAQLVEHAVANGEGRLAKHGPLVVETGKHTGRSAKDKFIVRDAETESTVWWGKTNVAMTPEHFANLKADFFKALGHPVRVRILELLRDGERGVGDLQAELEIDSSGTSQHLGALRRQGLLENRRDGTSVYYRVKDPRTFKLLEVARQILTSHYEDTRTLLNELERR